MHLDSDSAHSGAVQLGKLALILGGWDRPPHRNAAFKPNLYRIVNIGQRFHIGRAIGHTAWKVRYSCDEAAAFV